MSQTATYKGREYVLLWSGATRFGRRAKLGFSDGSKEFWVDLSAVNVGARAASPASSDSAESAAVQAGLQLLAGVCDGAQRLDGQGFNRFDAEFGHSLASASSLSPRQLSAGRKLLRKYQGQLPSDLCSRLGFGGGVISTDQSAPVRSAALAVHGPVCSMCGHNSCPRAFNPNDLCQED